MVRNSWACGRLNLELGGTRKGRKMEKIEEGIEEIEIKMTNYDSGRMRRRRSRRTESKQ